MGHKWSSCQTLVDMTLSSVRPLRFIFAQIMKKDMQAHKEACEFFFFYNTILGRKHHWPQSKEKTIKFL